METRPLGDVNSRPAPTGDVRIRPAYPRDLSILVDFGAALALETEDLDLDRTTLRAGVQSVLDDLDRGTYYVAEREGTVVGSLLLTREWSDWRNGVFWWIQSAYVPPAERGGGVFRSLYEHVLEKAKVTPGVAGLRLYVVKGNEGARQTYRAVGMAETDYRLFELVLTEGE